MVPASDESSSAGPSSPGAPTSSIPSSFIPHRVARELGLPRKHVEAALGLFGQGATLPFIARYRKERTGGLDEVQLRELRDRAEYLEKLEDRRATILESIREQGELTDELARRIRGAETQQELEDLYLPYRPKRRTRATMARERGLEPLADALWEGTLDDREAADATRDLVAPEHDLPDEDAVLQGARDILAERVSEDAGLRGHIRDVMRKEGLLTSRALRGKKDLPEAQRFRDYLDHQEPVRKIQSHRILAIRRGESEGILIWGVEAPDHVLPWLQARVVGNRAAKEQMGKVAVDAWERLLHPSLESEIRLELKKQADQEAIRVFGTNLENLLLQAPAGERIVLGLDPGFRTGVKAAVVSRTGAVLDTGTLFLHQEAAFRDGVRQLVKAHGVELVAVGNGTASRETEQAVREALDEVQGERPAVVMVNEAGASVYSASELAGEELPELDVSLRGAVSIARRLQDPLAELVKIDPRSIGVGQYQHDVNQTQLTQRLDDVVEQCVNRVGVEVNTASPALLAHVAGIGPTLARNLTNFRDDQGGLRSRKELLQVPKLGPKSFEQCAGFLRIRGGDSPLDATAVHPERYDLVRRMAGDLGTDIPGLVEDTGRLKKLEGRLERYAEGEVGLPTLKDILEELRRPGRDPRDRFEPPSFRDDVRKPEDLKEDMVLEGVVTNVVAFGAFVDIGVHQDGLVHISKMADRFVKDPHEIVSVGDRVKVRVLSVDLDRGRIGLSMVV